MVTANLLQVISDIHNNNIKILYTLYIQASTNVLLQVLAIPVSEELTLVVVVGEMDESIVIEDKNGIVTTSVKHK